ncbi:unnamed protein product [Polarella glacialis]|uniref:Peptidase A1 domain-containing protein n=1 Tax=Polarella glacialis TaxID=89957 RepID=A0A813KQJ6_POLGL|nr:unnamed protein product [Polarella glacialis]
MAGSFSPSSQCWSVLRTIIATAAIQVLALGIEVEVKPHTEGSLFSVALDVGSPPQRIWAGLDTASQWLWFPESVSGSPGFHLADSSSAVLGEAKR